MESLWKWKVPGYSLATLIAHFTSNYTSGPFASFSGLTPFLSEVIVVSLTGLLVGFMVEDVFPHYLHDKRNEGAGGGDLGGDFDSGGGGDLDLG